MSGEKTVFDKILAREIPAEIVYEDDTVLAFRDVHPQAKVHAVVIPKNKINRYAQLVDQDTVWVGAYFQAIAKVASKLGLQENGFRVVINNGGDAGQTVDYIHAHILGGERLGPFGSGAN